MHLCIPHDILRCVKKYIGIKSKAGMCIAFFCIGNQFVCNCFVLD